MYTVIIRRVTIDAVRKVITKNRCTRTRRLGVCCVQERKCTMEAIPPAQSETETKEFSPKIRKIVDDISQLTLLEVSDLNDLLKKTLNIQDTPMMAMGSVAAVPAAREEEEENASKEEKTSFTVQLVKFDEKKKVALIKELKAQIEGMNLVQAKKFVESAPAVVKADMPKDEAEKLKTVLTEAGGTLEIN